MMIWICIFERAIGFGVVGTGVTWHLDLALMPASEKHFAYPFAYPFFLYLLFTVYIFVLLAGTYRYRNGMGWDGLDGENAHNENYGARFRARSCIDI
jgi:hypothetical protein